MVLLIVLAAVILVTVIIFIWCWSRSERSRQRCLETRTRLRQTYPGGKYPVEEAIGYYRLLRRHAVWLAANAVTSVAFFSLCPVYFYAMNDSEPGDVFYSAPLALLLCCGAAMMGAILLISDIREFRMYDRLAFYARLREDLRIGKPIRYIRIAI